MDRNSVLDLARNKIKCEKEVKLLGVTIDFELRFNSHFSNICKKASRQCHESGQKLKLDNMNE
jgi:predicted RNA-binding protein Jag